MNRERLRERLRGLFRIFARQRFEPDSDDGGSTRKLVECAVRRDGRERISFYRRSDGLWVYSVDKFYIDDIPDDDHHLEYWHPIFASGFYDSLTTARREAVSQYPWMGVSRTMIMDGPEK